MSIQTEIETYINSLPGAKRTHMQQLHEMIVAMAPANKQWFLDGKNNEGKVVSNPNIGYGTQPLKYADGSTKEFYQVGISANTSGISVYIMGIDDKSYLSQQYGATIGKATVTGYCIKFKSLDDINLETLKAAIQFGFKKNK